MGAAAKVPPTCDKSVSVWCKLMSRWLQVLWVLWFVGIAGLAYSVVAALKKAQKSSEADLGASSYSIYVPSPVERAALQQISKLWPETFNAARPLSASKLPLFYSTLFAAPERSNLGLTSVQMAVVRNWSMDANVASIDFLRKTLLVPAEKLFSTEPLQPLPMQEPKSLAEILKRSASRGEDRCSLFSQERLFRIAQAWPEFQKSAKEEYQKCVGKEDLLSVWFELNEWLFVKSPAELDTATRESLGQRLTDLHQKGSPVDSHLAERLSQAAFLRSTHGKSAN